MFWFLKVNCRFYKELTEADILKEISVESIEGHQDKEPGTKHYVTPDGVSSLVKHFIKAAGTLLIQFHQHDCLYKSWTRYAENMTVFVKSFKNKVAEH